MEGIPAADLAAWKRRTAEELGLPNPDGDPSRPKKHQWAQVALTPAEAKQQLAAHKALMGLIDTPPLPAPAPAPTQVTNIAPPPPPPPAAAAPVPSAFPIGGMNGIPPPPPGFMPPPGIAPPPAGMPFPPPGFPMPLPPGYVCLHVPSCSVGGGSPSADTDTDSIPFRSAAPTVLASRLGFRLLLACPCRPGEQAALASVRRRPRDTALTRLNTLPVRAQHPTPSDGLPAAARIPRPSSCWIPDAIPCCWWGSGRDDASPPSRRSFSTCPRDHR